MSYLILIVDDDEDTRAAFAVALRSQGYTTVDAPNGSEGLRMLQSGLRPDLILLDVDMPVLDGVGFRMAQLRDSRLADLPVLLITAECDVDALQAITCPQGVLTKPVSYAPFLAAVRGAVKPALQPGYRAAPGPPASPVL